MCRCIFHRNTIKNLQNFDSIGLSEEEKEERRKIHMAKETDFLRLKRTRLTVADFTSLKVIGRGAFGEVFVFLSLDLFSIPYEVCIKPHVGVGGRK